MCQCFVYLIFMSVFSVTIHVNKPNEQFYQMNRALRMLILDNEFEFDTFANWGIRGMEHVVRTEEAWAAIYNIIIPNIMDSGIHESPEGTVHGVNFMLGGMRLRQIRVNSVNCTSKLLDQTGKPTAMGNAMKNKYPNEKSPPGKIFTGKPLHRKQSHRKENPTGKNL